MALQVVRWLEAPEPAGEAEPRGPSRPALLTVERAEALRQLREEISRRQSEWREAEDRSRCPTGWGAVDTLLGGGFRRGAVSALSGGQGAGATSVAAHALAGVLARGDLGAWVDGGGGVSAAGLSGLGMRLERLLWVRPQAGETAWTAQLLARSGAFALVVVDWPVASSSGGVALGQRLSEAARTGQCALVLLPGEGEVTASFKARLEVGVDRPRPKLVEDAASRLSDEGPRRRHRLWVERSRQGGEVSGVVELRPRRASEPTPAWAAEAVLPPVRTGEDALWGELPVRALVPALHTRSRSRFRDDSQPVPSERFNPELPALTRKSRAAPGEEVSP